MSPTSSHVQLRGMTAEVMRVGEQVELYFGALDLRLPLLPSALEQHLVEGLLMTVEEAAEAKAGAQTGPETEREEVPAWW